MKPEKKNVRIDMRSKYATWSEAENWGYNQALSDYEAFLPSEGEIKEIIQNCRKNMSQKDWCVHFLPAEIEMLTKAIAKRMGI